MKKHASKLKSDHVMACVNLPSISLLLYEEGHQVVLTNFEQCFEGNWTNIGHSVKFTPRSDIPGTAVTFRNHVGTYTFQQFHFHRGVNRQLGSENLVDGS